MFPEWRTSLITVTPSFAQRSALWKTELSVHSISSRKLSRVCRFLVYLLQKASVIPSAVPKCCFPSFVSLNSSQHGLPTSSRERTALIIWYPPTSRLSNCFKSGFHLALWWSITNGSCFVTPCPKVKSLYTFAFQCGQFTYSITQSTFVPLRVCPAVFRYHTINHTVPKLLDWWVGRDTKDKCWLWKDFFKLTQCPTTKLLWFYYSLWRLGRTIIVAAWFLIFSYTIQRTGFQVLCNLGGLLFYAPFVHPETRLPRTGKWEWGCTPLIPSTRATEIGLIAMFRPS